SGLTWNPDNRLYHALEKIVRTPEVRIETEIETGVSPRQLRRLFDTHVGASAKTFANVVRFQHYIREASMQKASATAPHFVDYGYYDQAHFTREFKRFYGRTPSALR
ncbi:MAG TPA: helix-turn-helix domain-containing protein, partial [Flavobacterium sp.]|nr:helix-turn-helix domain-containing protein [Flavobacterium sp.]